MPSSVAEEAEQQKKSTDAVKSESSLKLKQKQTKIFTFSRAPLSLAKQKKINGLILNMIVRDLQPFSIVQDHGFV